jgi:hypothetical protein
MVFQPSTSMLAETLHSLMKSSTMYKCVDGIRREYLESYTLPLRPSEVATRMVEMGTKTTRAAVRYELRAISLIKNGENIRVFKPEKNGVLRGLTEDWDAFYGTYLLKLSNLEKRLYGEPPGR